MNKCHEKCGKQRVANRPKPNWIFTTSRFFCQARVIGLLPHNLTTEQYVTMQAKFHLHFTIYIFRSQFPQQSFNLFCKLDETPALCLFGYSTSILHQRFIQTSFRPDVAQSSIEFNYTSSGIRQQNLMKMGWSLRLMEPLQRT